MLKNTLLSLYGWLTLILIIILLVMVYEQYPNRISHIFNLVSNHFYYKQYKYNVKGNVSKWFLEIVI